MPLPSRRRFLGQLAGCTVASVAAPALFGNENPGVKKMTGFIDAHSHIWTRDVDKFPLAPGATVNDLKPPSFTAEEMLKIVQPEGVDRVVLIQHHIYHGWDNSYLIDAAARYPDAFRVVGMLDDTLPHRDAAMRDLLKKRVTAFRIAPRIRKDAWLDGAGIESMWRCGAETRQAMCCLIDPEHLAGVAKMCERFPDTPVVIDHFARIGADGQIRAEEVGQLCALAKHRNTYVKVSAYYALGKKQSPYLDLAPMIRQLYDAYGPQRLMWASDNPYQVVEGHRYADSIALVRDRLDFLKPEDKTWVLQKTAEQVYYYA